MADAFKKDFMAACHTVAEFAVVPAHPEAAVSAAIIAIADAVLSILVDDFPGVSVVASVENDVVTIAADEHRNLRQDRFYAKYELLGKTGMRFKSSGRVGV